MQQAASALAYGKDIMGRGGSGQRRQQDRNWRGILPELAGCICCDLAFSDECGRLDPPQEVSVLRALATSISVLTSLWLATVIAAGTGEGGEKGGATPGDARAAIAGVSDVTTMPVRQPVPLPHGLTYCDSEPCASRPPTVLYVCPTGDPTCIPTRRTTIIPRVEGRRISGFSLSIGAPDTTSLRLASGSGTLRHATVSDSGSTIILGSDEDVRISHYSVAPVWGGTTTLNFESTILNSALLESVFYHHASYETGTAAIDLHTIAQEIIMAEQSTAGLTSQPVTAFYFPPEMHKGGLGHGNAMYGNGMVGINYGSPSGITRKGGIVNGALPIFAHEYAHVLFDEIKPLFSGDASCLNEGIADALGFSIGFLPEDILGPFTTDQVNFDSDCSVASEVHDVGNCYFWHIKKAGLLTPAFLYGLFHPQHVFSFNSCDQRAIRTGNSTLVYFTEAAGGANMVPVLNSMKILHAGSYKAAKQALGLR